MQSVYQCKAALLEINGWLLGRFSLCGVLRLVLGLFLLAGLKLDRRVPRVAQII